MKAVIHKTGAIGEILGIERRDGVDYAYFENGLSLPVSEVGFLTPYEQYAEDCYDWADFRREAAKDILAGLAASGLGINLYADPDFAVKLADELIKRLKEGKEC